MSNVCSSVARVYSSPLRVCLCVFCVLIISQVPFRFLGVCVCLSPRAVCEREVNNKRRRRGDRVVGRGGRLRDGCAWPDPRFILAVAIKKNMVWLL